MNKQTEALKMVTDILDDELWFPNKYPDEVVPVCFIEALNACKEALEQPAQEPVAWIKDWTDGSREIVPDKYDGSYPVYTHPAPSWQGLSDDEIDKIWFNHPKQSIGGVDWLVRFARAIENALKEKNHG